MSTHDRKVMLSGKLRKGGLGWHSRITKFGGEIFEKARVKLESFGPSSEYMASAVHAVDNYCYAAYAAPGWIPAFIFDEDGQGVKVFEDIKKAEAAAREQLVNSLNANLEVGWIDGLREP
jgi:hypothetical protein